MAHARRKFFDPARTIQINNAILNGRLFATIAKLVRPGGVRAVVAESLVLKHQLVISSRARRRAPNLNSFGRLTASFIATNTSAAIVAKAATSKIPLVFIVGDDPLKFGLVASYNRPGGNATGINVVAIELEGKRLGILRDVVPGAEMIAALVNPDNANAETQLKDIQNAARALGRQVRFFNATTEVAIDEVFTSIAQQRIKALAVAGDTFFISRRNQIITLAAHYAIPTMYQRREFVEAGGLISYGTDYLVMTRQAGIYVGRILKGEKPVDLPVMQPTKFELVINLKTAKRLNLDLPATVLALADEVIE